MASLADSLARVAWSIAVIGEDAERVIEMRGEIMQFCELILRESFGWEQIEGARVGIFEDRIQRGQVVAKCLPRGGRRDDDHVLALANRFRSQRLV